MITITILFQTFTLISSLFRNNQFPNYYQNLLLMKSSSVLKRVLFFRRRLFQSFLKTLLYKFHHLRTLFHYKSFFRI